MFECIDGCIKCCIETEMLLTPSDVARICSAGFSPSYFCERRGSFHVMKNIGGRCVFLNQVEGRCVIYGIRPIGCRAYPVVYDVDLGAIIVDRACPSWSTMSAGEFVARASMLSEALRELGLADL